MEPIEPIDYQREAALSLAVQYTLHRNIFTANQTCEIADTFLKYLKGEW